MTPISLIQRQRQIKGTVQVFLISIMANKNYIFIMKLEKTSIDIDKFINTFFYIKFRKQENMSRRFRNAVVSTTQNIMGLKQISYASGCTEVTF
jgi:hypothetical protein